MKKALMGAALAAVLQTVAVEKPFGPNVYVFSPADSRSEINRICEEIFKKQHHQQFGKDRYALLFKPGDYSDLKTINIGYYTQLLGLGRIPLDTVINNVKTPCALPNNNATCNFWVGIENLRIVDTDNNEDPYFAFQWAVSQAAPARRLSVDRKAVFDWFYGWASGGYVADCVFKKQAGSYSQQQYYYRNCEVGGVFGINWNNVIHACTGNLASSVDSAKKPLGQAAPTLRRGVKSTWTQGGSATLIESCEFIREKPFLFLDGDAYKVFVPAMRRNAAGPSWSADAMGEGRVLDLKKDFYVAEAWKDSAATLNAALAKGRHILFTPGIYHVAEPLQVTKPGTVLLGLGEATIVPDNDEAGLVVADVDGVSVAGLIFDSERHSKHFVVVGAKPSVRHAENPIVLHDVIYRVGGTGAPGKVDVCLEVNSHDTIIDHTWVWRADHGAHTGWNANTAKNGIVVNGDHVIGYGLFVEHFQEYDVLWAGENGRTYFFQNEKCYDPPGNAAWLSHGGKKKGYAAYKVTDNVTRHYAVGLGVYDVFIKTDGNSVFLDDAVEVPDTADVLIENVCTVEIANGEGPLVGINHIVNGKGHGIRTGKGSGGGYAVQRLTSYCNGKAEIQNDFYQQKK